MQTKLLIICMVLIPLITTVSFAQSDCDASSIDTAESQYAIGRLTECINSLSGCLQQRGFTAEQQVRAWKLIAMSYLAMDIRSSADSAIQNLFYLKPDFEADLTDPDRFKNELLLFRSNQSATVVSSVSKRPEDIRLAPATVSVITGEDILQRGYTDLVDILKDIPGFDVSVYYGQTYANAYQRGLRTNNTDKTLLLIDGIEDNDIWSNFADISQQYPITNIKRVEIIYGPASTMYGPNAFSGVINVITKDPKDYLHSNRPFGVQAQTGVSSYNTKYLDMSAAYKKGIVSCTITGRVYGSDRPDLSGQEIFDYDPYYYDTSARQNDNVYKKKQRITTNGKAYLDANHIPYVPSGSTYTDPNGLFTLNYNPAASPPKDRVDLTDSGAHVARRLDQQGYSSAAYSDFNNPSRSYYITAKLSISNFSVGATSWSKEEGAGTTYTDRVYSVNGTRWKPRHTYLFTTFNQPLNSKLNLAVSANYRIHQIGDGSKITRLKSYASGDLDLLDLENKVAASSYTTYYFEQSQQFRSEIKLTYTRGKYFNLVGGVEIRNGAFQKYYLTDTMSKPSVTGRSRDSTGNNFYNIKDIGVYAQAAFRTRYGVGLTAGARVDNNTIQQRKGLGTTLSPRVVTDYAVGNWVWKAIYSAGIQNISNFTRFGDVVLTPDTGATSGLRPERISNFELSASRLVTAHLSADVDGFYSIVNDVVSAVVVGPLTANQNIGKFRIWGLQANVHYKTKNFALSLNYTFTHPRQVQGVARTPVIDTVITTAPGGAPDTAYVADTDKDTSYLVTTGKPVGDIASSKINAVFNYTFGKHYGINLRLNYVGSKKVGPETSVPNNLLPTFPAYFLANAAFTLTDPLNIKGVSIQVVCNNIFDKQYASPGIRGAGGLNYANQIYGMGRNFSLRLNYAF